MSDLSRVLGDLYGEGDAQPTTTAQNRFRATAAPEWADESRLDEAFAGWTPGPPADAHAIEREMSVVIDTPVLPPARLDEDLAATLSAALVDAGRENGDPEVPMASAPSYTLPDIDEDEPMAGLAAPAPTYVIEPEPTWEPEPVWEPEAEVVAPVPARPWSRTDDDILPGKAAKGAKAPKAPKAKSPKVKTPKSPKAPKAKKADKADKADKEPKAEAAPSSEPKKFFGIQLRRS